MRYSPIVIKARELIALGMIGKICSVNFVQNCPYGNSMYHNFRRTMAGGGGMFIEKATHDFDVMMFLIEAIPVRVTAIAKRQAFGGDKPNNLQCTECEERLTCKESINNMHYRSGFSEVMEVKGSDALCVYAKEVNVPDNEVCLMEFDNGIFGTYWECFFSPSSYTTREYEIIGLNGIMRISFSMLKSHGKGEIIVCPRFGTPEDIYSFEFDYRQRIHYNGGGEVAKHFFHIMNGDSVPITTVKQAFIAETLAYAATLAARERKFIDILDIIPEDLRLLFKSEKDDE
ncbi:MAG: putative oxidoreductase YteT [candidate division WS2 bacterium]|nr:putative oxidoreductase YteT [Candidatus Psychracetigena formicireducens]